VSLEVRPDSISGRPSTDRPEWATLFATAGLDFSRFRPVDPVQVPQVATDARGAWLGTYVDGRSEQVRVEAAFWEGRPVLFSTTGSWTHPATRRAVSFADMIPPTILLTGLVGAATFAQRNTRLGRGDRRGATRITLVAFVLAVGAGTFTSLNALKLGPGVLLLTISQSSVYALAVGCLYLAGEPHVRRHWPDALISWSQLLTGQMRSPLMASHVLTGITLKLVMMLIGGTFFFDRFLHRPLVIESLDNTATSVGLVFVFAFVALVYTIVFILLVILLRLLLRRPWLGDLVASLLFSVVLTTGALTTATVLMGRTYFVLHALGVLWLLRRYGLLAVLAGIAAEFIIVTQPLFYGVWYTSRGLLPVAVVAVVSAWALWVIVADRQSGAEPAI
jgi:hypothetical protein